MTEEPYGLMRPRTDCGSPGRATAQGHPARNLLRNRFLTPYPMPPYPMQRLSRDPGARRAWRKVSMQPVAATGTTVLQGQTLRHRESCECSVPAELRLPAGPLVVQSAAAR